MSRQLAGLLAGMAAVAIIAIAAIGPTRDAADPSSHAAGRAGTLALYSWLDGLGFATSRLESGLDLDGSDVLLSVAPRDRFEPGEVDSVMAHLSGGGDAVIAIDGAHPAAAQPLLDRLGLRLSGGVDAPLATPAQPIDAGGRVARVPLGPSAVIAGPPGMVPLLTARGEVVAAAVRVGGAGRAYVLGTSLPLSNDGLRHDDAAGLVLTLLERARGGRIAFDEVHHGEGRPRTGAGALLGGPLGLAALLGGGLLLAHRALSGRRLGRPLPPGDPAQVPSASRYVEAMASLQAGSRARGGVATRYAEELKLRTGIATGVDPRLPDPEFLRAISGLGAPASTVPELLGRARRLAAASPSEDQLVALARDIDAAETTTMAP